MAKKGKLTGVELHYILTSGKSVSELAVDLDRPEKTIQKILDENTKIVVNEKPEVPPEVEDKPKRQSLADYMISAGAGGRKGVIAMTPTASQRGDEGPSKADGPRINLGNTYKCQ